MLQHQRGHLMVLRQIFQNVLRGGDDLAFSILQRLGQVHPVEQDIAKLLRGVDIEAVPRAGVNPFGQVIDHHPQPGSHLAQQGQIHTNADLLHPQQHIDQRKIDDPINI